MSRIIEILGELESEHQDFTFEEIKSYDIKIKGNPAVSIYPDHKQATFYDNYINNARSVEELKPIIEFLDENKYETNLEC